MGMSRHDSLYEPVEDYTVSDGIKCEVYELLKDEYNPCNWGNFCEAFEGVQDPEVVTQLEEMLEKRDFEALGRKLWSLSYDYHENHAIDTVLNNQ